MSRENVELVARFYEPTGSKAEFLTGVPRIMEFCDPEVEWTPREERSTYRGREGVREALESWLESFADYRFEVQRIVDCGSDDVLVVGLEVGRGAMSGVEVRSINYELLTIRDGMIVRFREFYDESAALEAAGLSESRGIIDEAQGTAVFIGFFETSRRCATPARCSSRWTPPRHRGPALRLTSARSRRR